MNHAPSQKLGHIRHLWTIAGLISLGIGIIGAFLPVLPTTPLVLLAAFCFGKGSPRLRAWILSHPRFGAMIQDWEETGAIPPKVKAFSCSVMAITFAASCLYGLPTRALIAQGVLMGIGAAYVLMRPSH